MNNIGKKYYKGMRIGILGLPDFSNDKNTRGAKKDRKRSFYHPTFYFSFPKTATKNLVVMYDIPYAQRKERDWFRRHLKRFGFSMIQKSVWVGPSPLPKEFLEYVKEIKLDKQLKTFKLAKNYEEKLK